MPEIVYVADLETDGLSPSRIWMLGIQDLATDEYTSYVGEDVPSGLLRLLEADVVVGHNFKGYDAKVIKNLTDGLIDIDLEKIDDTVELSRILFPKLKTHKLKSWGEIFGYPKLEFDGNNFANPSPQELIDMEVYLKRDVLLTAMLYRFFLKQIEAMENDPNPDSDVSISN